MFNIDKLITTIDDFVRIIHNIPIAQNESEYTSSTDNIIYDKFSMDNNQIHNNDKKLTDIQKKHSAGLMRVNHVGEVCAQALYKGQQFGAKDFNVINFLKKAELEEIEHLNLCYMRLQHLNSHTSYLNPLWYSGAFALGLAVSKVSDASSLAFAAETEKQVESHLRSHLDKLPQEDILSKKIVEKMAQDEAEHANYAKQIGANTLPELITFMMKGMAKVMTIVAYYV